MTHSENELSIVIEEDAVPGDIRAERGWVALRVAGQLDFSLIGVLATLTSALADAKVPVFIISTFDTDYLLVPEVDRDRALVALQ